MKKLNGIHALIQEIKSLLSFKEKKHIQMMGATETLMCLLLQGLFQQDEFSNPVFLIFPHQKDLVIWHEKLLRWVQNFPLEICSLPYHLVWGPERYTNHVSTRHEKLKTLYFLRKKPQTKIIILTTLPSLAQFTMHEKYFLREQIEIKMNEVVNMETFIETLIYLGYQQTFKVEDLGQFSVRGGIVDVFPIHETHPLRLEWVDDKVSSIRVFHSETQKSLKSIEQATITPCSEVLIPSKNRKEKSQKLYTWLLEDNVDPVETKSLVNSFDNNEKIPPLDALSYVLMDEKQLVIDHLLTNALLIYPQSLDKCQKALSEFYEDIKNLYQKDKELHRPVCPPDEVFCSEETLLNKIKTFQRLEFGNPVMSEERELWTCLVSARNKNIKGLEFVKTLYEKQEHAILLCETEDSYQRAEAYFKKEYPSDVSFDSQILRKTFHGYQTEKIISVSHGFIPESVKDDETYTWILSDIDIFELKMRRHVAATRKLKNIMSSFRELSIDSLVVHIDHGIGRYKGIVQLDFEDYKADFLLIEYRQADKIYLPVERLNLLQKYKKEEGGKTPVLDKLGSDAFVQRKAKALKSAESIAEDLIKIHAERKILRGHKYSPPNEIYEKFVEDFPYQETEDQIRCLEDLEVDFMGIHPIDRLVVGDVGFGKTEIALRAALRTILEGYQVMFLVPTTVLCYQHFHNFTYRLEKYGIKIGQIHRLIKRSAQKESLLHFKNGNLDFLIGTHRILSQDVVPKNLGLLIVDEEQRFGVVEKEKFKKLKANIDILTLSATPIPRTLHMALLGLREISLITTPPANRMPVKTIVSEHDEKIIKIAIESEILRGGQVFYIHNRVGDLSEVARKLEAMIPSAKIKTAHGQMHEQNLDNIVIEFIEQKFNVLVCTTIIESGVDMPNVNTLIVEHAENFGLSQLHQLRGRVGRSSIQAYAYLLTKNSAGLTDEARKRLDLLVSYQDLGSGFQLANYDLELRGAGSLIGREQSGQISGVGLELYVDMLDEKIKELSSIKTEKKIEPEIRIKLTAVIPRWYVEEERERLTLYKSFFSTNSADEILELKTITEDRYGKAPIEFIMLIKVALLRLILSSIGAISIIEIDRWNYEIRYHGSTSNKHKIQLDKTLQAMSDLERMELLLEKIEILQSSKVSN